MTNICVFCRSKENLNTEMTVTLDDGSKVSVSICDTHAEDATARTAKQKYIECQREMDELAERARELGMTVSMRPSGLAAVTIAPPPRQAAAAATRADANNARDVRDAAVDADMIDTAIIDSRDRGMVSVGGNDGGHHVESYRSVDTAQIRESIDPGALRGKVKMEVVETSNNRPIAIPTKRVDGLGTTRIRVVPSSDADLQKRFKALADQSRTESGWDSMHHYGKDGYREIACPICRGDGSIRRGGSDQDCPKCGGRGSVG